MWLSFHIIIVFITTLRVLSRDDLSPVSRLAWFMVLILVPVMGFLIYFLFGEANLGRTANTKHEKIFERLRHHFPNILDHDTRTNGLIEREYEAAFEYAASINGFHVTAGNKADLLPDAAIARSRLIEDIDAATSQVHILYYIWLSDKTGTNVVEALSRAAKRGVKCRVMVDGLGSRRFIKSPLWEKMKTDGVEVAIALPFHRVIKTLIQSRLDLRNHRKIAVIDGRITYCGSQNCADPEFRVKPKYAPWVDILLRFEGPVVAQNQLLFISDWLLHNENKSLEDFIIDSREKEGGFPALVWGDGPTERIAATPQMFATLFNVAKTTLTISTPYFVPNETVMKAMTAAAYRGVEVALIFPALNDSWIVAATSRSYYRELLSAGIEIFEYEGGLLHSKTVAIDGVIGLVGSSNMDLRSFDLNYENNILLRDEVTTRAIEQRQSDYISSSRQVLLAEVDNWPLPERIWYNVIATLGPVL